MEGLDAIYLPISKTPKKEEDDEIFLKTGKFGANLVQKFGAKLRMTNN